MLTLCALQMLVLLLLLLLFKKTSSYRYINDEVNSMRQVEFFLISRTRKRDGTKRICGDFRRCTRLNVERY